LNIQGKLPYLGKEIKESEWVSVRIFEHEGSYSDTFRPDYINFKNKVYNNESDCADVMVGLTGVNGIYDEYIKEYNKIESPLKEFPWEVDDPFLKQTEPITSILISIKQLIDIGIATNEIGNFGNTHSKKTNQELKKVENESFKNLYSSKLGGEFDHEIYEYDIILFDEFQYYHSLSFLDWMQRNAYPIPNELQFGKRDDGSLFWVDDPKRKTQSLRKIYKEDNKSPIQSEDEELLYFLSNIYPEIDRLYLGMVKYYKNRTNKKLIDAYENELKEAALSFYDENIRLFTHLKKQYLEQDFIYGIRQKQRKATIGKILKIMVDKLLSHVSTTQDIITDANSLYELAFKICR